jgi:hypothetical protein
LHEWVNHRVVEATPVRGEGRETAASARVKQEPAQHGKRWVGRRCELLMGGGRV